MKFNDLIAGKSLSIANLLSLSDKNLAKKIKEHEFKYISCFEDSELGGENLIRCEIGSISYVLALLCKYANLSCDEFFSELDDGLISGECNVGEEEFEELGEWIKDVKKVWKRYVREDEIQGGFGLGLNIVSEICQKHEILYGVDSVYGEGSTFYYKFKRA